MTKKTADTYYLVIFSDIGAPSVETFETLEQMADALVDLQGSDITVMPFCGRRLYVSQGDMKYLLDEGHGAPIPLFTIPQPDDDAVYDSTARFGAEATAQVIALGTPADVTEPEEETEE